MTRMSWSLESRGFAMTLTSWFTCSWGLGYPRSPGEPPLSDGPGAGMVPASALDSDGHYPGRLDLGHRPGHAGPLRVGAKKLNPMSV